MNRYRWSVFSRVIAAFIGGYALTSLLVVAVSLGWPGNRALAVLSSTLVSFLIYAGIIMAVFHASSATRAWQWIAGTCLLLAIIVWLIWPHGGAV